MKKSFLMLGILGSVCAIDAFAARTASNLSSQDVVVAYACPAGCYADVSKAQAGSAGITSIACYYYENGAFCGNPTITILETESNSILQSEINKQLKKQEKAVKKSETTRAAVNPKVVKKVVYEQVVEEDEE